MNTAGCYIRVSTDDQVDQNISIPFQKSRIIAYCQALGIDIYDFYIDDGCSGKDIDRPEIKRLILDAHGKKFNSVVVFKLDRLSRRQKDILHIIEDIFEPNGIGFKSVLESFDTSTPFGKAALGMMAVFAQLERETIIERVVVAKKEAARQGRYMGGLPPFGYRHNAELKRIEIDPVLSDIVRRIYAEYLTGTKGYQAIADMLTSQKVPAPNIEKSVAWNRATIQKILTNPVYAGYLAHKGNLYPGQHEAIIDQSQWDGVQSLIKSRNKYTPSIHSGLVSGLIYCGECGARMRTKNVWQNYPCTDPKHVIRYYICYSQDGSTPYMAKREDCDCGYKQSDRVDEKVIETLLGYSLDPKLLRELTKEFELPFSIDDKKLKQISKELSSIQTKLNKWYSAFEKDAISSEELVERVRMLRETKSHLEAERIKHLENLANREDQAKSFENTLEILKQFGSIWKEATEEERKFIIKGLISSVTVYKDNRIKVSFFPETS